jgi:hypothetical protein
MGQLGFEFACSTRVRSTEAVEDELFVQADANELLVGAQRLEAYLIDAGFGWVVRLASLLKENGLCGIRARLSANGPSCAASAGRVGVGGLWDSQPAMVVTRVGRSGAARCGRMVELRRPSARPQYDRQVYPAPQRDPERDFLVALVKSLMRKLHLAPGTVAGAGPVIEAAATDC